MRRILFLSKHFSCGHGGTPEAILLLARALRPFGVACDVRCSDGVFEDVGTYDDLPPAATRAGMPHRLSHYSALIVTGAWIPLALPIVIAARAARMNVLYAPKGQLCRIEFRRFSDTKKLLYLGLIEIWIALLAHRILFTSKLERRHTLLPAFLLQGREVLLPEPIDAERFGRDERPNREQSSPLHFGFIGQVSARKGLAELVEGFLAAAEARPDIPALLSIAGTPLPSFEKEWQAIKRRCAMHREGRRIRFLGQIAREQRTAFYNEADVIIAPSHFESYGLVVVEALWHGCAAIAGRDIGVLEYLRNCAGITVLPENSSAMIARAISAIGDNAGHLVGIARRQRHQLPDLLSGEVVAASLLPLFSRASKDNVGTVQT